MQTAHFEVTESSPTVKPQLIPLTGGKFAIVDECDFEWLNRTAWHVSNSGYVIRRLMVVGRNSTAFMHREVCSAPAGVEVDHVNGNKLDNRSANLRLATRSENMRNTGPQSNNTSGFKGVSFQKDSGMWSAKIGLHGVRHHLGLFRSAELAHAAYCEAAKRLHGEFACVYSKTAG